MLSIGNTVHVPLCCFFRRPKKCQHTETCQHKRTWTVNMSDFAKRGRLNLTSEKVRVESGLPPWATDDDKSHVTNAPFETSSTTVSLTN